MQEILKQVHDVLKNATASCEAQHIALSGGLDSTILAYFLQARKPQGIAIISKDYIANDLTYCQTAAQAFGVSLSIKMCDIIQIEDAIQETIRILKNFNDIEIRNNIVPYLAISEIKNQGFDKIITGDGADELFAGYNFLIKKQEDELAADLKRIAKIMHFPSQKIGQALGVKVESPFCDDTVMEFARNVPVKYMIGEHDGKKFGKFILREAFEDKIPKTIVWRQKSPMQEGAGTQGLTEFFERMIPDSLFIEKLQQIKAKDNVTIRTKESLHYYEIFSKYHKIDNKNTENSCPDCHCTIEQDSRFCRMCGRFPV